MVTSLGGRLPFVGRQRELDRLDAALDAAVAGRGGTLLIAGEPGIGKTRLAEELAERAAARGASVLWGRCWEGDGAPAFWPWVEVLRAYVRRTTPDRARSQFGTLIDDLTLLVPELRDSGETNAGKPIDSDQARFRMFESVSSFLRIVASGRGLVVVLDDLHWADEPSLLLLRYLAREAPDAPLLLAGTYRDGEVGVDAPLARALDILRRERGVERLTLAGLASGQLVPLVRAMGGATDFERVARVLHERTDGNPFFVQEILRHLTESGDGAVIQAERMGSEVVPSGVREVILRRLARLSPRCHAVLTVAAVIGREFGLGALEPVLGTEQGERQLDLLYEALDAAEAAKVIGSSPDRSGTYSFVHALVRETLYGELTSVRRIARHRQIGAALETLYAGDLDGHAAELAYHFVCAAPGGDVDKAVRYATLAGERAMRLLAYEEAARHFGIALQLVGDGGPQSGRRRCELLLALGDAQTRAGDTPAARAAFSAAADASRILAAPDLFVRAALGFGGPVVTVGIVDGQLVTLLEEALLLLGNADSVMVSRTLGRLAMELLYSDETVRRDRLSRQAVAMARRLGDGATLAAALYARHYAIWEPATLDEREKLARELVELGEQSRSLDIALQGRRWLIPDLLELGDRDAADREIETCEALAAEARQPLYRWYAGVFRAAQALLDGRFREAESIIEAAYATGQRAQSGTAEIYYRGQRLVLFRELGRIAELAAWLESAAGPTVPVFWCLLALLDAEAGRIGEARARLDNLAPNRFAVVRRDLTWSASVAVLAEVCLATDAIDHAAVLYEELLPFASRNAMMGIPVYCGPVARYLGLLSTTRRQWEVAERHFEQAQQLNLRLRAPGWAARRSYDHARMLLRRGRLGDEERAMGLLRECRNAAEALGMVRLQQEVEAQLPPSPLSTVGESSAENGPQAQPRTRQQNGLTRREYDVLRLIAAGHTTREIAETLVVSPATVERHITNVYTKIGARGRADATAFAFAYGIAVTPKSGPDR